MLTVRLNPIEQTTHDAARARLLHASLLAHVPWAPRTHAQRWGTDKISLWLPSLVHLIFFISPTTLYLARWSPPTWRARRHGRWRLDVPRVDRRSGMHPISMAARSHGRTRRLVRLRQQLDVRPLHGRRSQGAPVAMAKLQLATAAASSCWNRGSLLESAVVCATRSMPCRRKLHPAVKSDASNAVRCRELQACTSELRPATRGAARGEAIFCGCVFVLPNQFCFCWNRCIFLLELRYFFLLQLLQSSQMLMSFLLEPKFVCAGSVFYFASTDHWTLTRGEDFCWKIFAASDFCCLAL